MENEDAVNSEKAPLRLLLVTCCCVTKYHKAGGLKQHTLSQFLGLSGLAVAWLVFSTQTLKATVQVSPSGGSRGESTCKLGGWQNSFSCICGTEGLTF